MAEYEGSSEMHHLSRCISWFYADLAATIGGDEDVEALIPPAAILAAATSAAQAIIAAELVILTGDAVVEVAKPSGGKRQAQPRAAVEDNDDEEDEEPPRPAGARAAKSGKSGRRRKARNVRAYCGCGCDCYVDFDLEYTGCECDPKECRNEYEGEDQGACGCIKPKPLAGGTIALRKDPDNPSRWRWVEAA